MPPTTPSPSIESRLTRVEMAVTRLEGQVSQLVEEFGGLKERVETMEELKDALKGVGKEPGLISDIRALSDKITRHEEAQQWLTRLVVGAIVAQILAEIILK